jgi:hypothetical protein
MARLTRNLLPDHLRLQCSTDFTQQTATTAFSVHLPISTSLFARLGPTVFENIHILDLVADLCETRLKGKDKVVPLHTMEALRGEKV